MMKVFRQLDVVLRDIERNMMNNSTNMRSHSSFNDTSIHSSPPRAQNSFNRSADRSHRSHNLSAVEDSSYLCLFSDEITVQIYEIMQRLFVAKVKTCREIERTERDLNVHSSIWNKFLQFIGWLSSLSLSFSMAFEEKKKTPMYLEFCLNVFSGVFNIPIEDVAEVSQANIEEESDDEIYAGSDILNVTPSFMKQRLHNITYTGDPFLLPVRDNEVRCLVRFFHQVSCKINEMVSKSLWVFRVLTI
jgi:Mitochondrial-associated sphingomyelin phosphodiesterase